MAAVCLLVAGCGGGDEDSADANSAAQAQDDARTVLAAAAARDTAGVVAPDVNNSQAVVPVKGLTTGPGWVSPALSDWIAAKPPYTPTFTGRAWYVDIATGNDANPGTLAAPWRTFAPVVNLRMAAGDALLLKCGDTYRGTLELTSTQAPSGNVLIGAYGDCSGDRRPVIRASDWISPDGWVKTGPIDQGIYAKTYTKPVSRLFVSGKPLLKARFPNYQRVGAEFVIAAASSSFRTTTFKVSPAELATLADKDVVGATIYLKVAQWETEKAIVAAYDRITGLVTLDRAMPFSIQSGSGYILEGKAWMLDAPGEWLLDDVAKKLSVWTPTGASPAVLAGLEASWRSYGVIAKWFSGLRVERIAVEQQDLDGFELTETPDAVVSDVKAVQVQEIGVSALTAPRLVVQDSFVDSAGFSGITARECDGSIVRRNRVIDTGGNARAAGSEGGIVVMGTSALAENNSVERSAFIGIRFANRAGTVVRGNTVMFSCQRFTDCAGIYTYTGGNVALMPPTYVPAALVTGNVVLGAKSVLEGCGYSCANMALGIYLDELTAGTTVSGNIVSDTEVGIGVLNGSFNQITGNMVRGSVVAAFRGTKSRYEAAVMRSNQVVSNSFFADQGMAMADGAVPADTTPVSAQYWYHYTDASQLFLGSDRNVVTGNQNIAVLKAGEVRWTFARSGGSTVLKEADWRTYAPTDTQFRPAMYRQYAYTAEPSLVKNGGFDPAQASLWRPYLNPQGTGGSFSMGKFAPCTGNCGRLVSGSTSDYLASSTFTLNGTSGQNLYVAGFTAIGGTGGSTRRAFVRRDGPPYENFGLNLPEATLAAGASTTVEAFFRANASASDAVLDLRSAVGGQTHFANASVARVQSIEFRDQKKLMSHVVNPTTQAMSFPCSVLGLTGCDLVDETGAKVAFPIVVPARSSRLVFVRDPKWMQ